MLAWAAAFALTLAIESPVYVLGLRRAVGARRAALWSLGLNLFTHPGAWALTRAWSWPRFGAVELGVWLIESAGLLVLLRSRAQRNPTVGRVLVLALTANALSAGLGLLI